MRGRDPSLFIAAIAFFALLFVALFGARAAPHEPIYFVLEHGSDPRPYDPGLVFPFGSDVLGRDLFSVVLAGAGATLAIVVAGGLARVIAGLALSLLGALWRPSRVVTDAFGALASSVPATIVALLIVKAFVKTDTTILVFVGALLVTGWAGPYRVLRAELDRLARQPFTESASALGVGPSWIAVRHHVPHLVPLLAMSTSQQIVASLVLLAELGVLGIVVGPARQINVTESLTRVNFVTLNSATLSEFSDWGGLIAGATARSVDSLWVTRWLFLVPGIAFALTAVLVATIGFALARRYARHNVFNDLRGRGVAALVAGIVVVAVVSALVPERYAAAREWAQLARESVRSESDAAQAFASAGLRPVSRAFAVERDTSKVLKTGAAKLRVGGVTLDDESTSSREMRPLIDADTGGDTVDAPLVFVSRGVSPSDYQPQRTSFFSAPDLGTVIAGYADDYAGVDVRGKIVVLQRFMGVVIGARRVLGPDVGTAIDNALKRGAAAVLFVDPSLPSYVNVAETALTLVNPYARLEQQYPLRDPAGRPVIVLSVEAANRVLAPTGLALTAEMSWLEWDGAETKVSRSRALGVAGHIEVPLERRSAHVSSTVGEVPAADASAPRIVVWSVRRADDQPRALDVALSIARLAVARGQPFMFVDFDPAIDQTGNAKQVAEVLGSAKIALVIVLDGLSGSALRFTTPFGDVIPAIDLYADRAGARHLVTRSTTPIDNWKWPGSGAYPDTRAVLVQATGAPGDMRPDAAALIGYLMGRRALGAEELR